VQLRSLDDEQTVAHWGLLRHDKKKIILSGRNNVLGTLSILMDFIKLNLIFSSLNQGNI
jgi:hypothetical protein